LCFKHYVVDHLPAGETMFCAGLIGSREISANTIGFLIDSFAWMVIIAVSFVLLFN